MSDNDPKIGQVVNHFYLWKREAVEGHEEGRKPRRCAVARVDTADKEGTRVYVAPISHVQPDANKDETGIELPNSSKRRLGLDDERSWLYTSELNHFLWPGFDLKKTADGRDHYGTLPANLIHAMRTEIADNYRNRQLKLTNRDDKLRPQPQPELRTPLSPEERRQRSRDKPKRTR